MPEKTSNEIIAQKVFEYRSRASVTRRAHYLASDSNELNNKLLGVPVVVITAVVGTTIFGTLESDPDLYARIAAGIFSIAAAVLASLQTYLNFGSRAAKHKEAGASYAAMWRAFDFLYVEVTTKGEAFNAEALENLKKHIDRLNEIALESPNVPDNAYKIARGEEDEKLKKFFSQTTDNGPASTNTNK
jgi:hypothetical protein